MTINLSSEALLHLLTEALKENEALEARLRKTEEARRKLSREKTALETKVASLRQAGLQLWMSVHKPTEKEESPQIPNTNANTTTINGPTVFVTGSVTGGNFNGGCDSTTRATPQRKIPPWMDALANWRCATADRQQH